MARKWLGSAQLPASVTGAAPLLIPHGTAPSSPTNGEVWSTTTGFFARVNGNTRTIAVLEAAQTFTGAQTHTGGGVFNTVNITGNASIVLTGTSHDLAGLLTLSGFGALSVAGLSGANLTTRYVGGSNSAAPASGTFVTGDYVVDKGDGTFWVCTSSGSPGTWSKVAPLGLANTWGAKQTFFTATTGAASIRLPHGTAPTSPVDGDMWTTSAGGLYVRINGATVGPLGAGGGGGDMVLATQQTVTGRKTFVEATGGPSLQARTPSSGSTQIFSLTNNGNTVNYLVVDPDSYLFGHGGTTSPQFRVITNPAGGSIVLAGRDSDGTTTFRDSPSWTLSSTRWTGAASVNESLAIDIQRTSATAGAFLSRILGGGGGMYISTSGDKAIRIARGTDSSPTADILALETNAAAVLWKIDALGKMVAVATATTTASINLPHGTAPTSPVNGDMWTTSAGGLYVRINGATIGPLGAGGGGGDMVLASDQTSTGQKIFSETAAVTPLIARTSSTPGTFDFEVQNNAGSSRYFGVSSSLGVLFDHLIQVRPVLPADAGNQNRSSQILYMYSAYWNGSATTDDPIQIYNQRSSTAAKNMDLFIANGGVLITPTTDHIGLRVLRGTDSSPTQRIQQWNNAANNVELAAIDANGKFIAVATATATASVNLPHGTAPSSPVNGDMWTTSAGGLYVRINGVTVGPIGTATGTKVSALTAVGTPASTDEFPVNQGGTSKKMTLAQIDTYVTTSPVFAAGSASANTWPKLTAGTVLTTPEVGAVELDANCFYMTTDAGNRGVVAVRHFIRADATRTFTSNTSSQAIFTSPTNGRLTLETGLYQVNGVLAFLTMSATSGNLLFNLLGAGGATLAAQLYTVTGADVAAGTASAAGTSWVVGGNSTPASAVTAAVNTGLSLVVQGTFEVSVAGTIVPSITMVTASASVLQIGSYLTFERMGSTSVVSVGQWD